MKSKTWSRKRIDDEFSTLRKKDGTPMCRQAIHMMRKKSRGLCLTCAKPAIGVYCLEHTIAARERMRKKLGYKRRLNYTLSYKAEAKAKSRNGKASR